MQTTDVGSFKSKKYLSKVAFYCYSQPKFGYFLSIYLTSDLAMIGKQEKKKPSKM